jgi:3D (Asp-Asp-Asp) domain-containing protein
MTRRVFTAAAVLAAVAVAGCGSDSGIVKSVKTSGQDTVAAAPTAPATTTRAAAPKPAQAPAPRPSGCGRKPVEHLITTPRWLGGFEITEYFSVSERWFVGRRVRAPGIPGRHRVDWLYSSNGVAMEGDGIGLDGRHYHFASGGDAGWFNAAGRRTRASACASRWSHGLPRWLEGGWRNTGGEITFPLEGGGWSNGTGVRELSYAGVTFAPGSSQPLRPYRTVAVDPDLIPKGSRLYIPAYRSINGGWFVATDTGGAIIGRHIDVYRPPTSSIDDGGRYVTHRRVYVQPPGTG